MTHQEKDRIFIPSNQLVELYCQCLPTLDWQEKLDMVLFLNLRVKLFTSLKAFIQSGAKQQLWNTIFGLCTSLAKSNQHTKDQWLTKLSDGEMFYDEVIEALSWRIGLDLKNDSRKFFQLLHQELIQFLSTCPWTNDVIRISANQDSLSVESLIDFPKCLTWEEVEKGSWLET